MKHHALFVIGGALWVNSLHAEYFYILFCHMLFFFLKIDFFLKKNPEITSECYTVWNQIRPNIMLGLIWIQIICKGYRQMKLAGTAYGATEISLSLENMNGTSVTIRLSMKRARNALIQLHESPG